MSKHLMSELQFGITKGVFWTDSQVVLSYIKNQTRHFKTFVANRIQTINDHSDVVQWQYVPSKSNPADHGSIGLDGTSKMWYEVSLGARVIMEKTSYSRRN